MLEDWSYQQRRARGMHSISYIAPWIATLYQETPTHQVPRHNDKISLILARACQDDFCRRKAGVGSNLGRNELGSPGMCGLWFTSVKSLYLDTLLDTVPNSETTIHWKSALAWRKISLIWSSQSKKSTWKYAQNCALLDSSLPYCFLMSKRSGSLAGAKLSWPRRVCCALIVF